MENDFLCFLRCLLFICATGAQNSEQERTELTEILKNLRGLRSLWKMGVRMESSFPLFRSARFALRT